MFLPSTLTGLVSPPVGKTTNQEKETGDTCTRQTIPEIWGAKITKFHIIDNKSVSKTSEGLGHSGRLANPSSGNTGGQSNTDKPGQ